MILQSLAHRKGKEVVGHNIQSWTKHKRRNGCLEENSIRHFFTNERSKTRLREELAKEHVKQLSNQQKAKKTARAIDKDFFLSVLYSSATKREAKSYLQNFTPSKTRTSESLPKPTSAREHKYKQYARGVNLGGFYAPAAIQGSPKFVQEPQKQNRTVSSPQLHVAMVKIRAPQTLKDETLNGIGRTLSQLSRLGLVSVVVVDCNDAYEPTSSIKSIDPDWRHQEAKQANRILAAIESSGNTMARIVDNIIGVVEGPRKPGDSQVKTRVTFRKLLMRPLSKGVIAVVPTVGYTDITQKAVPVPASNVIMALTRELAGLPTEMSPDEDPVAARRRLKALQDGVSLDRLIIIDPLGGIPSNDRLNGYHVFLNMEQEFEPTKQHLEKSLGTNGELLQGQQEEYHESDLASDNPASESVEAKLDNVRKPKEFKPKAKAEATMSPNWHHLQNLKLARSVLSILPPSSSALLTSPEEAANSGKGSSHQPAGVGTRRQRNPLVHNLLTDRPVFSSSLPVGRLGGQPMAQGTESLIQTVIPTTFAKHGMSVTIFPDPRLSAWEPPALDKPQLTLTDAQIDLPRLVHLIEDSFGRKLDVEAYLKRVNHRIAGVIIAGEYEGGALLTWETPPGVLDDGSPENRARMVPYLDKFAVLKKRQGSATADLVFKAMVRDCFPQGVCWRSRKDNVVNKWYFERSRGTWKLPDTGWTMFWTTPDLSMERQTFLDYEGVCRAIEPSWADNKSILD